jgi:hypothetical protein
MNEFDEQMDGQSKDEILALLKSKAAEYYQGEETIGVLAAYEAAALRAGLPISQIEAAVARGKGAL